MQFSLWLGWRYIFGRNKDGFVSFISRTSMIGLALGIAVLIVVLSVMNGFARELQTRILGFVPHAILHMESPTNDWQSIAEGVASYPNVVGVAPLINLEAMLVGNLDGKAEFVLLSGVLPTEESKVSIIEQIMTQGSMNDMVPQKFGVVLGEILAKKLSLSIGDNVTIIVPEIDINMISLSPRMRSFTVVGIFSAQSEVDGRYGLIHIQDAAAMKGIAVDDVESVRISFDNIFAAPWLSYEIAQSFSAIGLVENWTRIYGNLFASIQMEKRLVGLLLFLIIAVAIFNILATLVILVKEKQAQIAILRTMGTTTKQLVLLFMLQGFIIWCIGGVFGLVIGVSAALYINEMISLIETIFNVSFLSADTYFINYFPSELLMSDVFVVITVSFVLCLLATIYPALKATSVDPAAVLRAE